MKPITKIYIKIFLSTGMPFGVIMVGIDLIRGKGCSLWEFLFLTFFFGAFMTLIFGSYYKNELKKNGTLDGENKNLQPIQKSKITSSITEEELLSRLKNDEVLGKMKMVKIDKGVKLSSGVTWGSWGETIIIKMNENAKGEQEFHLLSKPRLKTTIIDYGRNLANIKRVESVIQGVE